jgi:hypothetical protein
MRVTDLPPRLLHSGPSRQDLFRVTLGCLLEVSRSDFLQAKRCSRAIRIHKCDLPVQVNRITPLIGSLGYSDYLENLDNTTHLKGATLGAT